MTNNSSFGYLNGKFDRLENLSVGVMDRGLLYGDGCYEVIPVYHKKPFTLHEHLQRLNNSLAKIKIPFDVFKHNLEEIIVQLLKNTDNSNEYIYLQITRGAYPKREHIFPTDTHPTVFAYTAPFTPQTYETARKGLKAVTHEDIRWKRCDIKAISLLANVLLRQESQDAGADETILFKNDNVTEGAVSNVFIVKDNVVITPNLSNHILPGITRAKVIELMQKLNIPHEEKPISLQELRSANEIWLTSSTKEVMPVSMLDNTFVFQPSESSIWHKVFTAYQLAAHG